MDSDEGNLLAPIAGKIVSIKCKVGDDVVKGQEIVVLEAMKMENLLQAPKNGKVKKIAVGAGDSVGVDDMLIELE
jgi:propionyl-CoA carboxylase alpha chain